MKPNEPPQNARALKSLARLVLENADKFQWSLQGMGMLRLHMADNVRLHIWDSRYRVPGVSMIHDHLQWGLHSTIVSGLLTNRRYRMVGNGVGGRPFHYTVLKPGYGCFHKTERQDALLLALSPDVYGPGDNYSQRPDEIHETDAVDGTVTVMCKTPTDDESACVFWPAGTLWGSAEPRAATSAEVAEITRNALAVMGPNAPTSAELTPATVNAPERSDDKDSGRERDGSESGVGRGHRSGGGGS